METILQTTNLSRQFGKKMAVNNVNMTIHKGDIYGFIGKNGAGKTGNGCENSSKKRRDKTAHQ